NRLSSTSSTPSMAGADPYDWTWKARLACGVRSIGSASILRLRLDQAQQVLAVGVVPHRLRDGHDIVRRDVPHAVRDLLDAGDHESLALLDGLDERGRLQQRLVRSRVEPRDPAAELLDVELPAPEVRRVDVRDLELAAGRGRETRRDVDDLVIVAVETRHRVRRARPNGLLLETDGPARGGDRPALGRRAAAGTRSGPAAS